MITIKATLQNQLANHGFHLTECPGTSKGRFQIPLVHAKIRIIEHSTPTVQPSFAQMRTGLKDAGKMCTTRRRRSYLHSESDEYVLLEPGQSEEFVSEEELKGRLKVWLENWPFLLILLNLIPCTMLFLSWLNPFANLKSMEMLVRFSGIKSVWNDKTSVSSP